MTDKNNHSCAPWYILGAGSIGCLWASYWKQSGFNVVLLTRDQNNTSHIQLQRGEQLTETLVDEIAISQLAEKNLKIDNLFVSTKAQQTEQAIIDIAPYISSQADVLVVQNGMAVKKLPPLLPTQNLYTGITTDGAYRTAKRTVVHAGIGDTYIDCDDNLLKNLPTEFLNIYPCDNIEQRQWQKLVINCAINGLTAIYHCRNGELLNHPEALQRIDHICAEANAIALRLGIKHDPTSMREKINETLIKTASNYSSLYQDINNGRGTEIDYLNGYLCELANNTHLPCSENQRVWEEIKQMC
jgi:2-dehydropantoate 2-reductase